MTRLSQSMYLPVSGEFNIHHNDWLTYSEGQISFFLFFLWSRGGGFHEFHLFYFAKSKLRTGVCKDEPKVS